MRTAAVQAAAVAEARPMLNSMRPVCNALRAAARPATASSLLPGKRGSFRRTKPGWTVPSLTRDAEGCAARAVVPGGNVVKARSVRIERFHRISARKARKRKDGCDDRSGNRRSAKNEPAALVKCVVNRNPGVRIRIGRGVGLRSHRTTGVHGALEARLAINFAAPASRAQPRRFGARTDGC